MTLPEDTIEALGEVDPDAGWAIVKLVERKTPSSGRAPQPDIELVAVAARRSLIVVNRAVISALPGVNLIPLNDTRAFLALDVGRGLSDLELAVIDRLAERSLNGRERQALEAMRLQLAIWRRDQTLHFHARAIIVVERASRPYQVSRLAAAGQRARSR
jgi:hypothetical protein